MGPKGSHQTWFRPLPQVLGATFDVSGARRSFLVIDINSLNIITGGAAAAAAATSHNHILYNTYSQGVCMAGLRIEHTKNRRLLCVSSIWTWPELGGRLHVYPACLIAAYQPELFTSLRHSLHRILAMLSSAVAT